MFFPFYIWADLECLLRLQSGALIVSCESHTARLREEGARELKQARAAPSPVPQRSVLTASAAALSFGFHRTPTKPTSPLWVWSLVFEGWVLPRLAGLLTVPAMCSSAAEHTHWQICTSPGVVSEVWSNFTGLFSITDGEEFYMQHLPAVCWDKSSCLSFHLALWCNNWGELFASN